MNQYPIKTLRDIFNLPTLEQMKVCLDEISTLMVQSRATHDLMVATVNIVHGQDIKKAFEWPDEIVWTDDGKGLIESHFIGPQGDELFSVKATTGNASDQPTVT
jgi:hypothetical protein